GCIDLADAGWAGHVDLGEVVADHVQADEQQAAPAQLGPYLGGDPAVALAQRPRLAAPTGRQVAPGPASLGHTRQAVGHRLAVDHGALGSDHVRADQPEAAPAQLGPYLGGDPAVALAQRPRLAAPTGRQVAPGLASLGNTRQAVGHRLAVDHQDALVAIDDLGQ